MPSSRPRSRRTWTPASPGLLFLRTRAHPLPTPTLALVTPTCLSRARSLIPSLLSASSYLCFLPAWPRCQVHPSNCSQSRPWPSCPHSPCPARSGWLCSCISHPLSAPQIPMGSLALFLQLHHSLLTENETPRIKLPGAPEHLPLWSAPLRPSSLWAEPVLLAARPGLPPATQGSLPPSIPAASPTLPAPLHQQ